VAHQPKRSYQTPIYSVILSPKTSGILSKLIAPFELSSFPHAAFQLFGSAYQRKAPGTNDDDSERTAS